MRYVVGVDGGNSKTLAVVADENGHICGIGRSGNSNHQRLGVPQAVQVVQRAIDDALEAARLHASNVAAVAYALAGADLQEDFDVLTPALAGLYPEVPSVLDNDSMAALRAGSDSPDAVVVGWGSGTNGAGRNRKGIHIRLPALGSISGDWGGGAELGREMIWLVARAHDGRGSPTALTHHVLDVLGLENVDDMIRKFYFREIPVTKTIELAPFLFRAAHEGDAVAQRLVIRAAREVVTTACALLGRLQLLETPADVVLGGSVFEAEGDLFMGTIRDELQERAPLGRIVRPDVHPVVGAAFRAMDLLRIRVDGEVRARARDSYEGHTRNDTP